MKKYRLLLLSFVFIGTLLSSFHYHDDTQVDENCPACIVQNNLDNSPDVLSSQFLNCAVSYTEDIISYQSVYTFNINLEKLSRAPPKHS